MSEIKRIEDIIKSEGVYISTTSGISMYPMLRDRRDTIVISPVTERLRKYDVPLYKKGNSYVLHRIIKVLPDSYVICGDNCITIEKGIRDGDIIGKLTSFYRGDKLVHLDSFWYQAYCRLIYAAIPFRISYRRLKGLAYRLFKKNKSK